MAYTGTLRKPDKPYCEYAQKGDEGIFVGDIQKFINWYNGKKVLVVDNDFGDKTDYYVRDFQKRVMGEKESDGKFGSKTYKAAKECSPRVKTRQEKFMDYLEAVNIYVKNHHEYFRYSNGSDKKNTFAEAKKVVNNRRKTGLNCIAPAVWALRSMGWTNNFYAVKGSFLKCYKGKIEVWVKRITKGDAIGLTIRQAVDKKLLKKGDIICFNGLTHTFVYSGKKYLFYDAGTLAQSRGYNNGILVDYSTSNGYKNRKIAEVLRWR